MIRKITKNLSEIASTAWDLSTLRYPGFVYGRDMGLGCIPVFCFHGVESESLDAMLRFLDSNGYTTLHADEYVDILATRAPAPPRAVALTFDDGWGSLRTVGLPLFKSYGTKIIVFLSPGRIERVGNPPAVDPLMRDSSEHPLLTWEEIREMHATGLVDFQSHSFNHALVYRGRRIVDFANPELLSAISIMELPCPATHHPVGIRPPIRLGEPLYETTPRLSDIPQFKVDPEVANACASYVREEGGTHFFKREGWRQELENLARDMAHRATNWRLESPDEQREAIHFELAACKRAVEQMLPGKTVRHLCYPWHVAGRIAEEESQRIGYISNFWGKIDGRYYNPTSGDPLRIARVGGDFFLRLPGEGRSSLTRILMNKVTRRTREGSPYLTH